MNLSSHPEIMISATFADLEAHRRVVIEAVNRIGFFPRTMEFETAKTVNVIESSVQMLSNAYAYIGILSHRYGTVYDATNNPEGLSTTEIEYREALRRGMPILMFVMSEKHPVLRADIEVSDAGIRKLRAFKERIARSHVYLEFSSVEELELHVTRSLANLRLALLESGEAFANMIEEAVSDLPSPPQLAAVPYFASGSEFTGRRNELSLFDDWAQSDDKRVLIVESIGGMGKSALAWQWLNERRSLLLPDFEGVFWYSFYKQGSNFDNFCATALAYFHDEPVQQFAHLKSRELAGRLMKQLRKRRFVLAIDGLERVLIAYDRIDAAQLQDDEVPSAGNDLSCVRPSDQDLLRAFASDHVSKVIMTSRLLPTALIAEASNLLHSVTHYKLDGLGEEDALTLISSLGVHGDDSIIKKCLTENFANHPLMVGIVAGLVKDYRREPGNFDRWIEDSEGGATLRQSSSHTTVTPDAIAAARARIVATALSKLAPDVRVLLSWIAVLGGPVRFEVIEDLNPIRSRDTSASDGKVTNLAKLISALKYLESHGLLQWNRQQNIYDMHPVVRAYAIDVLETKQLKQINSKIADHFQASQTDHFANARNLSDVQQSIMIFKALVRATRFDEAASFLCGSFAESLLISIEAYHEILALLQPFFPQGFDKVSVQLQSEYAETYLANCAGVALRKTGNAAIARNVYLLRLANDLDSREEAEVHALLINLALCCFDCNQISSSRRAFELALELALAISSREAEGVTRLHLARYFRRTGSFREAKQHLDRFSEVRTPLKMHYYRSGDDDAEICWLRFCMGKLTPRELANAKAKVASGGREAMRNLLELETEFALQLGDDEAASHALERAIELSQGAGMQIDRLKGQVALVAARAGDKDRASELCHQLSASKTPPHAVLGATYFHIEDYDNARNHALLGYEWAWCEGPPYSHHLELTSCEEILTRLGVSKPQLPPFEPSKARRLACEKEVKALIFSVKKRPPINFRRGVS